MAQKSSTKASGTHPNLTQVQVVQITDVPPRLLTIPQAARYLSAAVWRIRTLLWAKQIPFIKLGKRFLIDRADLDAFVEQQKEAA